MSCITLTFAESGENHVGMEQIGIRGNHGFFLEDLQQVKENFPGKETELFPLHKLLGNESFPEAYVLVVRNAFPSIANELLDILSKNEEQGGVDWDKKVYMYGRVCNKKARYNLLFCDLGEGEGGIGGERKKKIEANYEEKQGTKYNIHAYEPLQRLYQQMITLTPQKEFIIEGNYYYNVKECYIGAHGDAERRMVMGYRLGETFPLHYQWYQHQHPISNICTIELHHGDMYIMSEKAVGYDWKKSSIMTLRHGAGDIRHFDPSFTKSKKKKIVNNLKKRKASHVE